MAIRPPILQVRIITIADHAELLMAELVRYARQLLGDNATYRTQTRTAQRIGYVRIYLTAQKEDYVVDGHRDD